MIIESISGCVPAAEQAYVPSSTATPESPTETNPVLSPTESNVVFGTVEPDYQFPWVVQVYNPFGGGCHGALISDRWVLTAAHCLFENYGGARVSFTRTDPTTGEVITDYQETGPNSVFWHPDYEPAGGFSEGKNDIALVKLKRTFPPNPFLHPAELPLAPSMVGQEGVLASGIQHTGPKPPGTVAVLRGPITAVDMLHLDVESLNASVCPGDSGSGFIITAGEMNFVAGILAATIWDPTCNNPNVTFFLTHVYSYLDWIRSITGETGGSFRPAPADYDGDGRADLGAVFDSGDWRIDLASNGFGTWDLTYPGYGDAAGIPVPADYDGDGIDDLSIKNNLGGWNINFSSDGFASGFNVYLSDYGDVRGIPVPADYDGDGKADLAIKNGLGEWNIDFAANGFETGFNVFLTGYGDVTGIPVPADYDGDGKADLGIKNSLGEWNINFATDGFESGFNVYLTGYGFSDAIPVPADYDGDGKADLSVRGGGTWFFNYAGSGFGAWNYWRDGYGDTGILEPRDYDGDGKADLALVVDDQWLIDFASSQNDGWNAILPIHY